MMVKSVTEDRQEKIGNRKELGISKPKLQDLKLDLQSRICPSNLRSCNLGFEIPNSFRFPILHSLALAVTLAFGFSISAGTQTKPADSSIQYVDVTKAAGITYR